MLRSGYGAVMLFSLFLCLNVFFWIQSRSRGRGGSAHVQVNARQVPVLKAAKLSSRYSGSALSAMQAHRVSLLLHTYTWNSHVALVLFKSCAGTP